MGGCLFDEVKPRMRIYREEVFGPVLSALRFSPETAIRRAISPPRFRLAWSASMSRSRLPLAYYTFGGWKRSAFGDLNQHGPDAVCFYTKTKTVSCRWSSGVKEGASFVIPMMT
jgi:malonate-semialdehyde dehydrogenase (acetylating)/methylmalonate-semialdehyde dehydrogenase